MSMQSADESMAKRAEAYLLARHGTLIHGSALWQALGYVSAQAFRKAVRAGTVPVVTFTIQFRRGRFAKTRDVARWIQKLDTHWKDQREERASVIHTAIVKGRK